MLRIAVVEDEAVFQQQLRQYLERYSREHGTEMEFTFFPAAQKLLDCYQCEYDILFLDILMPGINGMDAAKRIRKRDEDVVLVFITSLAQYAITAYDVGALDYLLKPLAYESFELKFSRVLRRVESRTGVYLTLNLASGLKRVSTRDIFYVEVENHNLHYHTRKGEIVVRGTMQRAEQELEAHQFAKCNHWYLVNLIHVTEVGKTTVTVAGQKLEMSRRSRAAFLAAVANCLGGGV